MHLASVCLDKDIGGQDGFLRHECRVLHACQSQQMTLHTSFQSFVLWLIPWVGYEIVLIALGK